MTDPEFSPESSDASMMRNLRRARQTPGKPKRVASAHASSAAAPPRNGSNGSNGKASKTAAERKPRQARTVSVNGSTHPHTGSSNGSHQGAAASHRSGQQAAKSGSGGGSHRSGQVSKSHGGGSGSGRPRWMGKHVGKYRLLEKLGSGSYGRVFLAQDVDIDRNVALKVITAEALVRSMTKARQKKTGQSEATNRGAYDTDSIVAAGHAIVEEMAREARTAAKLEHRGIITIWDVDALPRSDGKPGNDGAYIAMQFVDGPNLQDFVKGAAVLDPGRACAIIADASDALHFAHDRSVVHRDVKPANLLLDRHGRCILTDFGLARLSDPNDASPYGKVVGTAAYMAPECALGNPAKPQSDQYSLGCTLFAILAKRAPYLGSRNEVLKQHINAPVPDVREVRPDVDPTVAGIITKMMSKEPRERFPSLSEVRSSLRACARSLPIVSAPLGFDGQTPMGGSGLESQFATDNSFVAGTGLPSSGLQQLAAARAVNASASAGASASGSYVANQSIMGSGIQPVPPMGMLRPILIAAAVVLLVAVSVLATIVLTGDSGNAGGTPTGDGIGQVDPPPPGGTGNNRGGGANPTIVLPDDPDRNDHADPGDDLASDGWDTRKPYEREPETGTPGNITPGKPIAGDAIAATEYDRLLRLAEQRKTVIVEGVVSYARPGRNNVFKIFFEGTQRDEPSFKVVWFEGPGERLFKDGFAGNPTGALEGRRIRVKFPLNLYDGEPQMLLTDPSQIDILPDG